MRTDGIAKRPTMIQKKYWYDEILNSSLAIALTNVPKIIYPIPKKKYPNEMVKKLALNLLFFEVFFSLFTTNCSGIKRTKGMHNKIPI